MFSKGQVLYIVKDANNDNYVEVINALNTLNASINDIVSPNISIENFLNESIIREYINNLPVNTLFAKNIFEDKNYFISLPMFSSHFSIPIKPGEYIWYFQDNTDIIDSKLKSNLRIKNFWVSRIHGTNISEDLNFSFYQRDFQKLKHIDDQIINKKNSKDKKDDKKIKTLLENSIKEINFEDNVMFNELTSDIESISIIENSNNNFKAFERYFSNNLDFSLQGSNNTLINLGRNITNNSSAAIDIVSGRNYLKQKNNSLIDVYESFNDNLEFKGNISLLKDIDDTFFKVINSNGYEESLKDPSFYFKNNKKLSNFSNEKLKESILSLDNDASRIYVSENELIDNKVFYQHYIRNQVENFSFETLPSIMLKSNNLRIIARKEKLINNENSVSSGSIRLVKESNNYESYSHLLMESDGNIYMDAPKINIGSSSRNKNDFVVSLCDSENSEPLVLGETLKTKLEELLDEVVLALTTINIATAPLGADVTSYITNINVKKLELSEFLSKQVKTS